MHRNVVSYVIILACACKVEVASGALGRRLTNWGGEPVTTTTTTTTLAAEFATTTTTTTTKVDEATTTTTTTTVAQGDATTTTTTTTVPPGEAATTTTTTTTAAPGEATTTTTTTTAAAAGNEATTTTTTTSVGEAAATTTSTTTTTTPAQGEAPPPEQAPVQQEAPAGEQAPGEAPAQEAAPAQGEAATTTTTTTTPAPGAAEATTTTTTTTPAPGQGEAVGEVTTTTTTTTVAAGAEVTTTTTTTTAPAGEVTTTTTTTTQAPFGEAVTTTTTTTTIAAGSSSVSTCTDLKAGWQDKRGYTCDDYANKQLCTPAGEYGPGWTQGTWEEFAPDEDETAVDVCCACGGGEQKWAVQSGPCTVDDDGCVLSPHYPDPYWSSESCTILAPKNSPAIHASAFNTEEGKDVLTINGVAYSGTHAPKGVTPEGAIQWSSDEQAAGPGWKLCLENEYYYEGDEDEKGAADGKDKKDEYYYEEDDKEDGEKEDEGGKEDDYYDEDDKKDGEKEDEGGKEDDYYDEEEAKRPATGPAGVWSVVEGPCTIDDAGCALSPRFPENYGNDEWCEIKVGADEGPISVANFRTESYFDYLTVNGQYFSGEVGPLGIAPTRNIHWSSDEETTAGGWRLCPSHPGAPPPFVPPPPLPVSSSAVDSSIWMVTSGTCTQDAKGCIMSPNYPRDYPNNGYCSIRVTAGKAEPIQVISFDTEHPLDYLQVNGVAYSGPVGPQGVIPQGDIIWSSDEDWARPGWKICSSRGLVPHDGVVYTPSATKTGGTFLMGSAAVLTIASVGTVLWCRRKKTAGSFEPVYGREGGSTPYGRSYMKDGL